jgi:hypothetical protein
MNLSPAWIPFLKAGGHEVKHWIDPNKNRIRLLPLKQNNR